MTTQFDFSFSKPIFKAGETLSGTLILFVKEGKKLLVKKITVAIAGEAKCEWSDGNGSGRDRTRNHLFYEDVVVINLADHNHNIRAEGDDPEEEEDGAGGDQFGLKGVKKFKSGEYKFPVKISLPHDLPSSFNGFPNGEIWYEVLVEIVMQMPMQMCAAMLPPRTTMCQQTFPIFIVGQRDISCQRNSPQLMDNVVTTNQLDWNHCSCIDTPMVTWTLQLFHRGFLPGDKIEFAGTMDNLCGNKGVKQFHVKLIMVAEYTRDGGLVVPRELEICRTEPILRSTKEDGQVGNEKEDVNPKKGKFFSFSGHLPIPRDAQITSSSKNRCKIINIFYYMRFKFRIGRRTVAENVDVMIGNLTDPSP